MTSHPRLFSPYDEPMWSSIAAREMRLQRCAGCSAFRYPPGPACPGCLGVEASWEPIAGSGRVLSWTTFHRQYLSAYPPPHSVVAVKLDEGPIMIGSVKPEHVAALAVDRAVRMVYVAHPDGYLLPAFEPA